MNDGSALTGTYTFTNASAIVQGNASADTSEIKVGDIVIDDNGDKVRVANLQPTRTVATSAVNASNEQITITNHGFVANTPLVYRAGGGTAIAGTGIADGGTVFVKTVSSANAFTVSATSGGTQINITGTGNNAQSFQGTSTKAFTAVETYTPSTNSGSSCTVTRPPVNFASGGSQIDANVFGITGAEAVAGVDNVTDIAVNVAGARYVQAPTVTIPVPTVRTIAAAKVTTASDSIEITGHNMRTGTEVKYQDGGGTALAGLADNTSYFVIRVDANNIQLASSLGNANAGTDITLTGQGNNAQTLEGIQAVAAATISGGKVTGITVSNGGSDYQAVPAITVEVPKMTIPTSGVNATSNVITFTGHGLSDTDQITYNQVGGGTLMTNVANAQTVFVRDKTANTFKIAATSGGTAINIGTGHNAQTFTIVTGATQSTAVASQGLGSDGDTNASEVAHIGWVKKTVGTGGRAGRVHYETLVAASSIGGDAEDVATPDS
tara:strand:- start:2941 stop:4425 length:1485 start_codon:yes stop_codon:yes gene_type:complete